MKILKVVGFEVITSFITTISIMFLFQFITCLLMSFSYMDLTYIEFWTWSSLDWYYERCTFSWIFVLLWLFNVCRLLMDYDIEPNKDPIEKDHVMLLLGGLKRKIKFKKNNFYDPDPTISKCSWDDPDEEITRYKLKNRYTDENSRRF